MNGGDSGREGSKGAWHEELDDATRTRRSEYWRRNVTYVGILLAVWFVVSYGLGVLWAEPLNQFTLPGTHYPVGFWFAQQGAIYVFVALIFIYVWLMNRLDREFDVDETAPGTALTEGGAELAEDHGSERDPATDGGPA